MHLLQLVVGAGCVLVGGVFFAFSAFVLPALALLPAELGAQAMRSVNVLAVRPPLMVAMFGTALGCLVLGVLEAAGAARAATLAGCALYLLGVVVVTVAVNVPLNDRLAAGREPFDAYVTTWGRWNHVRTLAGVAAGVLVLLP